MAKQSLITVVTMCEASLFDGMEDVKGMEYEYDIDEFNSLEELRQRILEDWEINNRNLYTIKLHVPDNCNSAVAHRFLTPGRQYNHQDEKGRRHVHAHVTRNSTPPMHVIQPPPVPVTPSKTAATTQSSYSQQVPTGAVNTPSDTSQKPSTRESQRLLNKRAHDDASTAMSDDAANTGSQKRPKLVHSTAREDPPILYVRIGTCKPNKPQKDDEAVKLEVVVVGAVQKRRVIGFFRVSTWAINGVQIGYCEDGSEIDIDATQDFIPDPDFHKYTTTKTLKRIIGVLLNGSQPYIDPDSLSSMGQGRRQIAPLPLPTAPQAVHYAVPEGLKKPKSASDVEIVAYFRDRTGLEVDINFGHDLRAWVEHNEPYTSFVKWAISAGKLQDKLDAVSIKDWDIEVWVLPQIPDGVDMYSWTRLANWVASDWLSTEVSKKKKTDRVLFAEVHIILKDDAETAVVEKQAEKQVAKKKRGRKPKKAKASGIEDGESREPDPPHAASVVTVTELEPEPELSRGRMSDSDAWETTGSESTRSLTFGWESRNQNNLNGDEYDEAPGGWR